VRTFTQSCKETPMGWIVLVALAVIVMIVIGLYNSLVRLRASCESAWADIDVQLKRRYDLIPNLVETVKAYAAQEKGALEAVINARAKAMSAQGPEAKAAAEHLFAGPSKYSFALLVPTDDDPGRIHENMGIQRAVKNWAGGFRIQCDRLIDRLGVHWIALLPSRRRTIPFQPSPSKLGRSALNGRGGRAWSPDESENSRQNWG
jgi:hypothetical protein